MYFIPTHAPPPVYDGSPLSEGALDTKRYPLSFICFLFTVKAFFEPRDYRVVFGFYLYPLEGDTPNAFLYMR